MECPSPDAVARMPLAEAVLLFWRSIADEQRLQAVWDRHRGRCYDWEISFPVMVQLVADALLDYDGSGRRSFEAGIVQGTLTASVQAAFKKLGRLPIAVSQAFSSCVDHELPIFSQTGHTWQPAIFDAVSGHE